MNVLELAVNCKCKRFVSYTTVQTVLDDVWYGREKAEIDTIV